MVHRYKRALGSHPQGQINHEISRHVLGSSGLHLRRHPVRYKRHPRKQLPQFTYSTHRIDEIRAEYFACTCGSSTSHEYGRCPNSPSQKALAGYYGVTQQCVSLWMTYNRYQPSSMKTPRVDQPVKVNTCTECGEGIYLESGEYGETWYCWNGHSVR